jgi:hypothetical protein
MSETTILPCPKCSQKVRVPSDRGRLKIRCPKCNYTWAWELASRPSILSALPLNQTDVSSESVQKEILDIVVFDGRAGTPSTRFRQLVEWCYAHPDGIKILREARRASNFSPCPDFAHILDHAIMACPSPRPPASSPPKAAHAGETIITKQPPQMPEGRWWQFWRKRSRPAAAISPKKATLPAAAPASTPSKVSPFGAASGNDCPADVVELVDTLFAPNRSAADEQKRMSAEKLLSEHTKRAAAVVPLRQKFRKDRKGNEYSVCRLLEAIGTPDSSFDLLVEIFKSGRKTKPPFDKWGNLEIAHFGPNADYATHPAYLLVCKIGNGPQRLRRSLSRTDYEEAVARAHAWSGDDRPLLAQALAEIGSELAVSRLLNDILQTQWEQERRDPAIRALGSIGHRYLPRLIEKLEFQRQDREIQTTYLRDILNVLALCGDKTCVDPIVKVARRDATIENDARRAVAAIATRDGSIKLPGAVGAEAILVRRLAPSGDSYVDRCFDCQWSELDEPRVWSTKPELKSVTDLANEGQDTAALAQLAKVWPDYRDHDFVYSWKARILARQGHKSDAISLLSEGMSACRKKSGLCATRAEMEYDAGDLDEAVVWWIRSAVSQISARAPIGEGPFLYLAYIADSFGDHKSKDQLLTVVDRWTQWGRLNDSATNRINSLVAAGRNRSMSVAISRLCKEFL